jgi:hypothetical protein
VDKKDMRYWQKWASLVACHIFNKRANATMLPYVKLVVNILEYACHVTCAW